MPSARCDVFEHGSSSNPTYLFANAGVMRGHLDHIGWKHTLANVVTPKFAAKDIDVQGYCVVKYTPEDIEKAKKFYGKD